MKIKVFADTICGWCFIGHTQLLKAMKKFKNVKFEIEHIPFQLNPELRSLKAFSLFKRLYFYPSDCTF